MESEQVTPVDSIKDVVRSSVNIPKFDKHLKKAGGHIGRNIVEIMMKTIVQKPLGIEIKDSYLYSFIISLLVFHLSDKPSCLGF